ncbi:hypothetical protein P691DRAFT_760760 [Macrolepiota fuliginosa MF-IS2]|uniref:F-box domain-containing protein n=1 Tax=Macrolepiota fuliginosa MF-IS2 TaxID=1400762 RepID=A0A9P5XCE3_9AGAR|nr:hypothetical protein P691DRAFT_760760 [Macrolepiota fuliginosa MF-IS2]
MDIPQEILNVFINFSEDDPQTLLNLCLVSRRCASGAQKVLYRSIRITTHSSSVQHGSTCNVDAVSIKLFKTFTQHNPSLAKYVQTFSHHYALPFGDRRYRNLANKSFQLMTNLESLTIFARFSLDLFQGCTFQLKQLFCPLLGPDHTYREKIYHFLSSQPYLKTLYIDMEHSRLPADCCNNLETLWGNQRTIENILPGRSTITCLVWTTQHHDHVAGPLSRISRELSNIHILALGGNAPYPSLTQLVPYMRSLRVLRLVRKPQTNLSGGTYDELGCLPDLVNLRIFVWSARPIGRFDGTEYGQSTVDQGRQRRLVTKWFRDMRVLEAAYFQIAARKDKPKNYLCWRRHEVDPAPVDSHEAVVQHGLAPRFSE